MTIKKYERQYEKRKSYQNKVDKTKKLSQ